jgi:hypothetical protein
MLDRSKIYYYCIFLFWAIIMVQGVLKIFWRKPVRERG